MLNKFIRWVRERRYIPVCEASNILNEKLSYYKLLEWHTVGVSALEFCHGQLLGSKINLYGYPTLDGRIYNNSRLEVIDFQRNIYLRHGNYRWSDDYNTIIVHGTNEPLYIGICVKRKELETYINNQIPLNEQIKEQIKFLRIYRPNT